MAFIISSSPAATASLRIKPAAIYMIFSLLLHNPYSCCKAREYLLSGQCLYDGNFNESRECEYVGSFLKSASYSLIMQEDCNLVLYDNNNAVWFSGTDTFPAVCCYATLKTDGTFVIYSPDGRYVVWASTPGGDPGSYVLLLQKNRDLVIYGLLLWSVTKVHFPNDNNHRNANLTPPTPMEALN